MAVFPFPAGCATAAAFTAGESIQYPSGRFAGPYPRPSPKWSRAARKQGGMDMTSTAKNSGHVVAHQLAASGAVPNHPRWPLLLYPGAVAIAGADPAAAFENLFDRNAWPAAWRNGIYAFHHFHCDAHEA